ncbi:MAG: ABC transporter permease [Ignavibacteria bacterium]|jgi:predicted permease
MFSHFLKIALRNLNKQRTYSFINIAGLALGMACSVLILLWVNDELSYDKYHENIDNLYRVEENQFYTEGIFHVNVTPYPSAPVWKSDIPEIENTARYTFPQETLFKYKDNSFIETDLHFIDPEYFEMFTVEILQGNINTFNENLYSIILTKDIADKFFGEENPISKTISVNNEYDVTVAAVIQNIPSNSTDQFTLAMPFKLQEKHGRWNRHWGSNSIRTYVQLVPGSSIEEVNKKMTEIVHKNVETKTQFMLFPYKDIHLHSYGGFEKNMGRVLSLYIFGVIAVFVLLIACINFMNLSTAKSANRAKEIGMRKVIGANRIGIIRQFLGESILMSFLGLAFALLIVAVLLNPFNQITGKEISFSIFANLDLIVGLIIIAFLTGLIAGTYPALFLSRFIPVKVLKGDLKSGTKGSFFRRVLVVSQFTISIVLIVSTLIVFKQLEYMRNKSLGFDKEQVLYINLRGELRSRYETVKNALENTPGVISTSGVQSEPGFVYSNSGGADWDGKDPEMSVLVSHTAVDFNYIGTMKMEMVEGRTFSKEYSGDLLSDSSETGNFIINEELARIMGGGSMVGKRLDFWGINGTVVGVMKNFHFQKINNKIDPLAFFVYKPYMRNIVIRISPENIPRTVNAIEEKWSSVVPDNPFDFKFLDDDFDELYRTEERMFDLVKYFSVLAIVIACLGLFGLASFTAEQKKKELGIRKVLGATEVNLTFLLCKEFFYLVLLSNVIALPAAFYVAEWWLQEFAYKISMPYEVFVMSGILAIAVALITVGYQALKAALSNPVESIKYE